MHKPVFVSLVELKPLEDCELIDPGDTAGAMVRLYASADSDHEMRARIAAWANEHRFRLVDIEWCVNDDEVEWEKSDDKTGDALKEEARTSTEIVFREFHVWGHDEE